MSTRHVGAFYVFLFLLASCGGKYELAGVAPTIVNENRVALVDPEAEEFRPTAKLLFIVDNSSSMQDEQETLANGIRTTFDQLKGYNLDIHVLTTSSSDEALSVNKAAVKHRLLRNEGNGYQTSEGLPELDPNEFQREYSKKKIYELKTANSDGPLQLRRSMNDDEINGVKQSLVTMISQIGASGSDVESGYCTILRSLIHNENNEDLIKAGDRVALVVISDDNDYSVIDKCTAEEATLYRWVAPVQSTRLLPVTPANTTHYSYNTTWGQRERLQLDVSFVDTNSPNPYWTVSTTVANTEYIILSYTYRSNVNVDGQVSEVVRTQDAQILNFDPAQVGNPPLAQQAECTEALRTWALQQNLLGTRPVITNCRYSYSGLNNSVNLNAAVGEMGTQTSSTPCSAATITALRGSSASLFPAGKRLVSCSHVYRASSSRSRTFFMETAPSGVSFTGANISCSSNANLRADAVARLSASATGTEAPSLISCTLKNRNPARTCNFDDVRLDSLPPGSTAADLPNQCSNANLKSYVLNPRTSCTSTQLQDLVNYSCTRTPKTTATEPYVSQPAKYEIASTTRLSVLDKLIKRMEDPNIPRTTPSPNPSPTAAEEEQLFLSNIRESTRKLLGESGFFFSAIVKPTDVSECVGLQPGSGERYRNFAATLGKMGSVHSICAQSYAPALDNISNFIVRVLNNAYDFKIKDTEKIDGIVVLREGQKITLQAGIDYEAIGGSVSFKPDVLQLGDKIELHIMNTYSVKTEIEQ